MRRAPFVAAAALILGLVAAPAVGLPPAPKPTTTTAAPTTTTAPPPAQQVLGVPFVLREEMTVAPHTEANLSKGCGENQKAVNGGYSQQGPTVSDVFVADSHPALTGNAWEVRVINRGDSTLFLGMYVTCAPVLEDQR